MKVKTNYEVVKKNNNFVENPKLRKTFDDLRHVDEHGNEYWSARELSKAMGYIKYDNFVNAINRARNSMISTGKNPDNYLTTSRVREVVTGNGAKREFEDIYVTRGAAYLIAMNADPNKEEVAYAQHYFVDKTFLAEEYEEYKDRMLNRSLYTEAFKDVNKTMVNHGVTGMNIGKAHSEGDKAFYGLKTNELKQLKNITKNEPIVNYTNYETTLYKTLGLVKTRHRITNNNSYGYSEVVKDMKDCNLEARNDMFNDTGMLPEQGFSSNIKLLKDKYKDIKNPFRYILDNIRNPFTFVDNVNTTPTLEPVFNSI